jgi:hypothetical protein
MIKGKIVNTEIDEKGNVRVLTEYRDANDTLIQTGATRYSATQGTTQEIIDLIKADVKEHCNTLLVRKFAATANPSLRAEIVNNLTNYEDSVTVATFKTRQNQDKQTDGQVML